jgi:hypothetical protein
MRLKVDARFERSLRRLSGELIERTRRTLLKLQEAPSLRGLNLEKLHGSEALYTVRVNRNFRILLRAAEDEEGAYLLVLRVDSHDATYRL